MLIYTGKDWDPLGSKELHDHEHEQPCEQNVGPGMLETECQVPHFYGLGLTSSVKGSGQGKVFGHPLDS